MFFDKNIDALRRADGAHETLIKLIETTAPAEGVEIYETTAGDYTLFYKGIYLHDLNGAVREAQETVRKNSTPAIDRIHIVMGIGLGYVLDEMFKASTGRVVVYEPDIPLLRFILENVNMAETLGSGRVSITSNQLELIETIRPRLVFGDKIDVVAVLGYAALLSEDIPAIMERLVSLTDDRHLDYFTVRHFHYKWLTQFFGNVHHFSKTRSLDDVAGKFAGKPALVVSRGPSLDKAIEDVKRLAGSCVVIAVGSAIRRLWQAGVTPDFAVFYDANGMMEQIHGIPSEIIGKISFLICPFTQELCFTVPSRDKFLFLSENNREYAEWMDGVFNRKHLRLNGGGTVSLIAFQAAMAMQCNPVVLVGQDLAFPNDQVYAGGIQLETNGKGVMTLKASEELFTAPETLATVKGQNGETLNTLKAYLSFIRHFEELAQANGRREKPFKLINTSRGGAEIRGYELMSLGDFADGYKPEDWKFGHALEYVAPLPELDVKDRSRLLKKAIVRLREGLLKTIKYSGELAKRAADAVGEDPKEEELYDTMVKVIRTRFKYPEFLKEYPLISYFNLLEHIHYSRAYNPNASKPEEYLHNIRAAIRFLATAHDVLLGVVFPPVDKAKRRLHGETLEEKADVPDGGTMKIEAAGEPQESGIPYIGEEAVV